MHVPDVELPPTLADRTMSKEEFGEWLRGRRDFSGREEIVTATFGTTCTRSQLDWLRRAMRQMGIRASVFTFDGGTEEV